MASFNVKIYGTDAIIKRLNAAPKKMMEESKLIIDAAVIEIAAKAKARVPVSSLSKVHLKDTIRHSKFVVGRGASVSAGNKNIRYAPYVEFGTGTRFQIPVYPNINMNDLEAYAFTFKRSSKQLLGVPHRPFMYDSYSEVFTSMIKKLKSIKI
jgi:HK97 gp10 family phage protein